MNNCLMFDWFDLSACKIVYYTENDKTAIIINQKIHTKTET